MKPTKEQLRAAGEKKQAERDEFWIEFYSRHPEKCGDDILCYKGNLRRMQREYGRMVHDNHYAAKCGDNAIWTDEEIEQAKSVMRDYKSAHGM